MTSFLSKVWNGFKTVLTDAQKALPAIVPVVTAINPAAGAILDDFSSLVQVLTTGASILAQSKGEEPSQVDLTPLVPQITAVLMNSEALAGKTISNQTQFQSGVTELMNGMRDVLASVGD